MKSEQAMCMQICSLILCFSMKLTYTGAKYRETIGPQPTHLRVGPTQCGSHIPMCGARIYVRGLELEFLAVVMCVALLAKHIET